MSTNRTPTTIRSLLILEAVSKAEKPMTPTEVNEALHLPKQSVHRLCNTLVEDGFLVRDETGKRLRPSARARAMANGLLHASHSNILRHQVLKRIAEQVQETVNFVVPEAGGMRYRDRVETDWPFRIQLPVGSNVPFYCTASGKVFMSSLPKSTRTQMVRSLDLRQLTPNTHADPEALLGELSDVRKNGYAFDNEEFVEGMIAAAVPVRDPQGRYFASLAFHGPRQRLEIADARQHIPVLQEGARRLTEVMFCD